VPIGPPYTIGGPHTGPGATFTGPNTGPPVVSGARDLDDLTDVDTAGAVTGDTLVREGDGIWRPGAPTGGAPGQVLVTRTAAVTLSGHRVVTVRADGSVEYADNTTPAHRGAPLWVTLGAAVVGAAVEVLVYGALVEPSWSWTPGPLYLGVTGLITQAPPSGPGALFLAAIGYATSATSIFLDRSPSIALI